MRRIRRVVLAAGAQRWLDERQRETDELREQGSLDTTARWKEHRPTMSANGVWSSLETMAGPRKRCMFCGDSMATDIEHFRPKKPYPEHMFRWSNLLALCWPCNRQKGTKFPCDSSGGPLLVDPTEDEPWDHLFFVQTTGQVVPRPDPETGQEDPRGVATVAPHTTRLNDEAITEARLRGYRTLRRATERFLSASSTTPAAAYQELLAVICDLDRPELVIWFFRREGAQREPFASVLTEHPTVAASLVAFSSGERSKGSVAVGDGVSA